MRIRIPSVSVLLLLQVAWPARAQVRSDTLHAHTDTLTRPVVALREITVTASRARRDEPASATEVRPLAIRLAPVNNTYELLRQTAGLEVHDQGQGPGFASDASLRGFSSDHSTDIALWIDGVPINEPVNGHAEGYGDWSLLFPEAVSSIDVLKGPTSPLYGDFALAGVVNVRTLDRMSGSRGQLSGGPWGRAEGVLMTGTDNGSSSSVLGLRGLREDGWRPNSRYQLGQGHARWVRDLSATTSFDAGVELYAAGWDSPGFLTLEQYDAREFDAVSDPTDGGFKRRAQERASVRTSLPGGVLWRSTLYATQSRWQLFLTTPPEGGEEEGTGGQTEEEDRRYGFGITSALTAARGRVEGTVGIEGRWDHSAYENWLTVSRVRGEAQKRVTGEQASGALFAQSLVDVGRHLRLSLGGRWDVFETRSTPMGGGGTVSASKNLLSPKLGLLLHLRRAAAIYANASRGFRQTDGVIDDPSLPLITAWAYESGVKLDLSRANVDIALFRMDVSDEQTFDPITLATTSGGRSRRQGVEIDVRASLSEVLAFDGDWTFNDAKYRDLITEEGDTLSGARVFNTARYTGSASLQLAPPASVWSARLGTNIVGSYTPFDEPGVEVPAYALLHAGVGVRVGAALLDLGVRNLLDRTYAELRAGGFVSPGQPRSLFATARYEF
jgi:outer membrane receptor protein involved in Fe transport